MMPDERDINAVAAPVPTERIAIGRVIRRTGWVLGRFAIPIFGLSLLTAWTNSRLANLVHHASPYVPSTRLLEFLGSIFLGCLLLVAVTDGSVRALETGRFDLLAALIRSVRRVPQVFVCDVFLLIASAFGFLCLVAPGLYVAVAWGLAPTLCGVERLIVTDGVRRSAELTSGHRWPILALTLMSYTLLAGALFLRWLLFRAQPGLATLWFMLERTMGEPVFIVLSAVTVVELRRLKEGLAPRAIIEVF